MNANAIILQNFCTYLVQVLCAPLHLKDEALSTIQNYKQICPDSNYTVMYLPITFFISLIVSGITFMGRTALTHLKSVTDCAKFRLVPSFLLCPANSLFLSHNRAFSFLAAFAQAQRMRFCELPAFARQCFYSFFPLHAESSRSLLSRTYSRE